MPRPDIPQSLREIQRCLDNIEREHDRMERRIIDLEGQMENARDFERRHRDCPGSPQTTRPEVG